MSIRPDWWIREMVERKRLIEPFSKAVGEIGEENAVSFGLRPDGYNARLDPVIRICDWALAHDGVIDPLSSNGEIWVERSAEPHFDVQPGSFLEIRTVEYFRIPMDLTVQVTGMKIYTRLGLRANPFTVDPGHEGHLCVGLVNTAPLPVRIHGCQGIAHLQFVQMAGKTERADW